MKLKVIIDSASGISQIEAEKLGLGFLSLQIIDGEKVYQEGIDIDHKWVINRLKNDVILKTSQPSQGQIVKLIEKYKKTYDNILVICVSSRVSGTFGSVVAVAKDYDNVHVFDSLSGSEPMKTLGLIAQKMAKDKKNIEMEDILKKLSYLKKTIDIYLMPKDLHALKRSGRISPTIAKLVSLLRFKIILRIVNGVIEKYGQGRSSKQVLKKVIQKIKINKDKYENITLLHFGNDEELDMAEALVAQELGLQCKRRPIPTCIGAHLGVGAIGFACINKE